VRRIEQLRADMAANPEKYRQAQPRERDPLVKRVPRKLEGMPPLGTREWTREYQRRRRLTKVGMIESARSNLRAKHGLTLDAYKQLFEQQRGRCCICGHQIVMAYDADAMLGKRGPKPNGAVIDHDHACCPAQKSCGRCVRGLLCTTCNHGLGHFRDDPQLMRRAADYIERHASQLPPL
jgi:hypothetical protein